MSPDQLAARRAALWRDLQPVLARTPALSFHSGSDLAGFPITDTASLRRDYGAWNSLGMSDATLRALAQEAEEGMASGELSAGWSTGSGGGARGLFLSRPSERADYLGQILARLLPAPDLLRRQRLALHLRASNSLYSDVGRRRFAFAHVPLGESTEASLKRLRQFDPTILIAPPHRLAAFARAGARFPSLRHLFCGSEPVSEAERSFVDDRLGLRPRGIYQATEGFIAAECVEGRLHLNDHVMIIELEPVPGTPGYRPIITDLRRVSQPIVRVRGDDYLEIDARPCPCGFAGRVIHPPQGRVTDIWYYAGRVLTPPRVVAAIEAVLGGETNWQAVAEPDRVVLRLSPCCPADIATLAARSLTRELGGTVPVVVTQDLTAWRGPKRRKVKGGNA
ncbi:hypothetical protein [Modicisalibacter sp. MOD 31.J]|uniref:hypothetical protein n=2 Tax=unclassified Modicisalibacter TaxID=2679913 RepID=UPI001CCD6772|nr:hypothetical protein [Modicisalibacter sp. MOD 31.J]MBZ9573658.1 hypothetical protein [Modicisalibacter sp. MOD 31.J]